MTTSYPKDKIKVLFLENISDKAVQYFKDQGYTDVKKISGALGEEELIKVIKEVHILGIRSDRKSTRLNSSHSQQSRMPSSA